MIASRAEELIASGRWQDGERLPPERELCRQFDVSRATLRQALAHLQDRGLVTRHQGRGTFVSRPRTQLPIVGVFSIRDAMEAHGLHMTTRVLRVERMEADRLVAADLASMPGDEVIFIERLRVGDGEPMVLDTAHLRADLFPGLDGIDFERRSLYHVLESDYGRTVAAASETLEPVILTPRECALLEVPAHTTALLTRRITTDADGTVLALGHVLLRGDRSRYIYKRTVDSTADRADGPTVDGTMRRLPRPADTLARRS
jgi:GntR family transcriptional regulator